MDEPLPSVQHITIVKSPESYFLYCPIAIQNTMANTVSPIHLAMAFPCFSRIPLPGYLKKIQTRVIGFSNGSMQIANP